MYDAATYTYDAVDYLFTGKERDSESGLDNFGARYNSSSVGRFVSVDPSSRSVRRGNPQTWNRYTQSLNNPLRFVDPDGESWIPGDGGTYSWVDGCEGQGENCKDYVANAESGNLVIYGSNNSQDITTVNANQSGVVDLSDVENQHDADFNVKDGASNAERFTSPEAAAGLFNAARDYAYQYEGDAQIVVTGASLSDGTGAPAHAVSHGSPNAAIDFRYMDANGQPIQSATAAQQADATRVQALFGSFAGYGFNQTVSGRPAEFGTGPVDVNSAGGQRLVRDHQSHGHVGIVPRPRPGGDH